MDPILEEMRRVKAVSEIRESRYRYWVAYLTTRIAELEAPRPSEPRPARTKAASA
jgi:hypothetical protein